jgi:hypothetical protein
LKFIPSVKIFFFNVRMNILTTRYDKSRLAVGTLSAVTHGVLYTECRQNRTNTGCRSTCAICNFP